MDKVSVDDMDAMFERMEVKFSIDLTSSDSILYFLTKGHLYEPSEEQKKFAFLMTTVHGDAVTSEQFKKRIKRIKEKVPVEFQKLETQKLIKEYYMEHFKDWVESSEETEKVAVERVPEDVEPFKTFVKLPKKVKTYMRYPAGTVINGVKVGGRIITHD